MEDVLDLNRLIGCDALAGTGAFKTIIEKWPDGIPLNADSADALGVLGVQPAHLAKHLLSSHDHSQFLKASLGFYSQLQEAQIRKEMCKSPREAQLASNDKALVNDWVMRCADVRMSQFLALFELLRAS
jgi:hypothetical protein